MRVKAPSPAFSFYPKDILSDEAAASMTFEELGAYLRLLCHAWLEGSIPADQTKLARLLKVPARTVKRLWPAIGPCFVGDGERLTNVRLERERAKQAAFSEAQREKGLKGGKPSHINKDAKPRVSRGLDPAKPGSTLPSSFPSSSPDNGQLKTESVAIAPAWSRQASDDWNARYGNGSAPGGRIGQALKPLVSAHGWDSVRPAWKRYLAETTHPSPSAQDFAAHFGDWIPEAPSAAIVPARASPVRGQIAKVAAGMQLAEDMRNAQRQGMAGRDGEAVRLLPGGEQEPERGGHRGT